MNGVLLSIWLVLLVPIKFGHHFTGSGKDARTQLHLLSKRGKPLG
jgi:hypothetical protein